MNNRPQTRETLANEIWHACDILRRDNNCGGITEYRNIATRIRQRFVKAGFWGDVFIQSEEITERRKGNTGFLTYYALKEGIEI